MKDRNIKYYYNTSTGCFYDREELKKLSSIGEVDNENVIFVGGDIEAMKLIDGKFLDCYDSHESHMLLFCDYHDSWGVEIDNIVIFKGSMIDCLDILGGFIDWANEYGFEDAFEYYAS